MKKNKNLRSTGFLLGSEMTEEIGRSMVEMLGTLSIMGVLSVMGVVGYKMAITRFRTNELLDGVSKQAALVAIQISNGATSPVLENLGDNSVSSMTFDSVSYTSGSDTFDLVITGVSDDIATQIQNQVGSNSIIRDIDLTGSTLTLTFNKDLSAGELTGGNSGNEQQQEAPVDLCSPNPCQHGGTCSGGICDCTGTLYTGDTCETLTVECATNDDCYDWEKCDLSDHKCKCDVEYGKPDPSWLMDNYYGRCADYHGNGNWYSCDDSPNPKSAGYHTSPVGHDGKYCNSNCLTGDTMVTMADGTCKRLDQIELGDKVLCINPETLQQDEDTVVYTDKNDPDYNKTSDFYDLWEFSDGSIVKTCVHHRFYNVESQSFKYINEWKIGEHSINQKGEVVELIKHEVVNRIVRHYKISTAKYYNYYANNLLTGSRRTPNMKLGK